MNKPFLLIVAEEYYPAFGTGDWEGFFETYEAAEEHYEKMPDKRDGYTIVNIQEWMDR